MMFVILSYDVAEKRCAKISKIAKKYLSYMQKSLYQGYLTEKQLQRLKSELMTCLDPDRDSIVIYKTNNDNNLCMDKIGTVKERGVFIF